MALDPNAESASADLPAFLAPPEGSPPYHGFPIVPEVEIDGFQLGTITNFVAAPGDWGDAFVIAPDGSRAGLVWETCDEPYFETARPPDARAWGVWSVGLPLPMTTIDEAREFLREILPELKARWMASKDELGAE